MSRSLAGVLGGGWTSRTEALREEEHCFDSSSYSTYFCLVPSMPHCSYVDISDLASDCLIFSQSFFFAGAQRLRREGNTLTKARETKGAPVFGGSSTRRLAEDASPS